MGTLFCLFIYRNVQIMNVFCCRENWYFFSKVLSSAHVADVKLFVYLYVNKHSLPKEVIDNFDPFDLV